jgi:hypothetical protein
MFIYIIIKNSVAFSQKTLRLHYKELYETNTLRSKNAYLRLVKAAAVFSCDGCLMV